MKTIFEPAKPYFKLLGNQKTQAGANYRQQKRSGIKEPTFHRSQLPDIAPENLQAKCFLTINF